MRRSPAPKAPGAWPCWAAPAAGHTPEIHHSDHGIQYAATAYIQMLRAVDAEISVADSGVAWQNGYAERLIRTTKEEEVDLSDYEDYNECRIPSWPVAERRRHTQAHPLLVVGYLTSAEFEERWRHEREKPPDVH